MAHTDNFPRLEGWEVRMGSLTSATHANAQTTQHNQHNWGPHFCHPRKSTNIEGFKNYELRGCEYFGENIYLNLRSVPLGLSISVKTVP